MSLQRLRYFLSKHHLRLKPRPVELSLNQSVATVSSLFQPTSLPPKDASIKKDEPTAKSQKLFNEMGVVRQSSPGMYALLPLGLRSLEKLVRLVDEELRKAGCQKLQLPFLTAGNLWQTTGRWESTGPELLSIQDRHKRDYVLSPTHEEAITELVASVNNLTYKQLPLKLYQITSKFRDEMKPRFGLLRGREFVMKDLYTFDKSVEKAMETYQLICCAYDAIFQRLGVPFVKVVGATGNIGGLSSHEYHFPSSTGEDILMLCSKCKHGTNSEVSEQKVCSQCGNAMKETKGIEVGHTFLLGTKYSKALNAFFVSDDGSRVLCEMGCYGIGISRILGASVEVLALDNEIRWPEAIAPYSVCVIGPKAGSKEISSETLARLIAHHLDDSDPFRNDVIYDDRMTLTIGKKLIDAKRVGYPYIVIAGKKATEEVPLLELHDLKRNTQLMLTSAGVLEYLRSKALKPQVSESLLNKASVKMSEKDFAPLSAACVRALSDKLYEKRKAAALEIEKMTKEFATINNTIQIKKLLRVLSFEFATSQNPHTRKGGLIGLAAMAIALGKDASQYMEELVTPILACFLDTDARVRYYACESLFNVAKVGRGALLPMFNEVFDVLAKLVADPDQNVKSGAELLDRLLKDIVTESSVFDVTAFMPLLRERIYTKNPFTRQFLISWLTVLHSVPHLDLMSFLPDILDGLFTILEDQTQEIKKMCESLLGEFLRSITENPKHVDFPSMINILIHHSQSSDDLMKYTAVTWISEFALLSGSAILPYTSGILTAILPCMAFNDDAKKDLRETIQFVNTNLMRLVDGDSGKDMELGSVVLVLDQHLTHNSVHTKVAVLKWIEHLLTRLPDSILPHTEKLFPVLLNNLSDPADQVVILTVEALAQIANAKSNANSDDSYFSMFMKSLLSLFSSDRMMQEERWAFIIRQLCVLVSAEDIYRALAEILIEEKNYRFSSLMVETLSTLLLTSSELFPLRKKLKDLDTKESCDLFEMLYKCWCHNPVATVALCLLSQNYMQASSLIRHFGNLEVTVNFLTEIDQLVQLIESPIFAYLRIELLEPETSGPIVHTLYGLLMLLPQSEAFHTLRRRLECVAHMRPLTENRSAKKWIDKRPFVSKIDFDKLTQHFVKIQDQHRSKKLGTRLEDMS